MTDKPSVAILAGGLATRLGALVANTPKALLDVAGRPFLAWQLELLARNGIDDVVLCLGHQAESVVERLDSMRPAGMRVRTSLDGATQLGTGGAIQRALPLLSDPFFIMYGDSYLRCDYLAVHQRFVGCRQAAAGQAPLGLMAVYRNEDRFDSSNVVYERGTIVAYDKRTKRPEMHHIDWGLGELTHAAFAPFAERAPFDLAELYGSLVSTGELVGVEMAERFYEIGSPTGLDEFRAWAAGSRA